MTDAETVTAWMREPDHAEEFSLAQLIDWVNRRPLKELHSLSEQGEEATSYHKFWIEERDKRIAAEAVAKLNTDARLRAETRLAETVKALKRIREFPYVGQHATREIAAIAGEAIHHAVGDARQP